MLTVKEKLPKKLFRRSLLLTVTPQLSLNGNIKQPRAKTEKLNFSFLLVYSPSKPSDPFLHTPTNLFALPGGLRAGGQADTAVLAKCMERRPRCQLRVLLVCSQVMGKAVLIPTIYGR